MPDRAEFLARAYGACEALARSHYENFPVASRLLPAAMRPHIAAVYAFARVADDIADEGTAPAGDRQLRLRAWEVRLHDAVAAARGDTGGRIRLERLDDPADPDNLDTLIIVALAHSIHSLDLPVSLFDDLLSAFGQDTMTTRYASWDDVFDYCRRSANPIGRLVLRIARYDDDSLYRSSDGLCTALQLTNFWQDLDRDWRAGRLYVPRDVQDICGADEADLAAGRLTPAWTCALEMCASVTREQFDLGRRVCDRVHGRLRLELRLTWLSGRRVLERVRQRPADRLSDRPTLTVADAPGLLWKAVSWRSAAS